MFQSAELRHFLLGWQYGWPVVPPAHSVEKISGAVELAIRRSPTRATRSRISGAAHVRSAPMAPIVQFGAQRGPLNPFGRFQSNNYNPPPEPYA